MKNEEDVFLVVVAVVTIVALAVVAYGLLWGLVLVLAQEACPAVVLP